MYSYVNAFLREKGKNKTWKEVNISLTPLFTVFTKYIDGYIVLDNPTISASPLYVNFELLKQSSLAFYNMTFELWLATLSNNPLPLYSNPPILTEKTVMFSDAVQARFKIEACKENDPYAITGSDLHELSLHKDYIDYDILHNRVLTTVNGFLHPNYGVDEHLIIREANCIKRYGKPLKIGLISFKDIGDLTQIAITEEMIKQVAVTIPLKQTTLIDLSLDLTNKSVMVSIGGYLHVNDRIIDVVNKEEGLVRLNMEYLSLDRRIFEMEDYLGCNTLGLTRSEIRENTILVDEIESNGFITKLLTLTQSFIIIVDNPNVTIEKKLINKTRMFGTYEYGTEPVFPLVSHSGRFMEYWRCNQNGVWVLSVDNNLEKTYSYETAEWNEAKAIKRHILATGTNYAGAALLKIASKVLA